MVHPRVNKIFAGVNQQRGVNKGEPLEMDDDSLRGFTSDQTEMVQ